MRGRAAGRVSAPTSASRELLVKRRSAHARRRLRGFAARILLNLAGWLEGARLIVRRVRPHPGAQLRFTDHDGRRYHCFLTDQEGADFVALELRHGLHARGEDRIQESQALGLGRLPFRPKRPTSSGLLALMAQDLLAWLRLLVLLSEHALASPSACAGACCTSPGTSPLGTRRTLALARGWPRDRRSPGSGRPAVLALSSVLAFGVIDVAAGRGIAIPREL